MSRNLLAFSFLIVSIFFTDSRIFAEVKELGFENRHSLRFCVRRDEDDIYLTRAQGFIDYNFPQLNRTLRFAPFFEYQSNLDTNTWWRRELGAEIGTSFFNGFFYYGACFQHVWQKEENYPVELLDETTEWESRFVITPPLKWWRFKDKLKLSLFNEYTFDFTRGQPTVNQVGVELNWQVLPGLKVPLGWRHIDRIHDFDNDMLEFSLVFSF
ncbi:MAG: hypothetical protein JW714_01885 [Candidatus Omnitrophica bacterium]|nr:hypothetical protein [Candidatus Omnitrophota bacterium]